MKTTILILFLGFMAFASAIDLRTSNHHNHDQTAGVSKSPGKVESPSTPVPSPPIKGANVAKNDEASLIADEEMPSGVGPRLSSTLLMVLVHKVPNQGVF